MWSKCLKPQNNNAADAVCKREREREKEGISSHSWKDLPLTNFRVFKLIQYEQWQWQQWEELAH